MRILKAFFTVVAVLLTAAMLAAGISALTRQDNGGETVFCFGSVQITVEGAGGAVSLLTGLLFAGLWLADMSRKSGKMSISGERLNAIGFGLMPGVAVWKIFEAATVLSEGKEVFEPFPRLQFVTDRNLFMPSRIEMICSVLLFAAVLTWLMARKSDLGENGDLLMTVACIWLLFRSVSETLRREPLISVRNLNALQIIFLIVADFCLLIWTTRRKRTQKSTIYEVVEWLAVLTGEAIIVLTSAGILTAGSPISDFAVISGCSVLCVVLMLLAGKDSRTERIISAGSDSPVFGS